MNVFVLSTGRCGSETFARACSKMTNYTACHESHNRWLHPYTGMPYRDLRYPDNHIEVDNRLSWFLGTLEKTYGPRAFYVHLLRRREEVARSLTDRGENTILYSFASGVMQLYGDAHRLTDEERYQIGLQYWDTLNDNIELFLRDKPHRMTMWLHEIKGPFREFWKQVGAAGDLESALAEWDIRHNATRTERRAHWIKPGAQPDAIERSIHEITKIIPERELFILADEDQWGASRVIANRPRLPFPQRDGQYWGLPPDDQAAIQQFESARSMGARFLVLAWPAFWWLEHYVGFRRHLESCSTCRLNNERIRVFELKTEQAGGAR